MVLVVHGRSVVTKPRLCSQTPKDQRSTDPDRQGLLGPILGLLHNPSCIRNLRESWWYFLESHLPALRLGSPVFPKFAADSGIRVGPGKKDASGERVKLSFSVNRLACCGSLAVNSLRDRAWVDRS